MKSIWTDEVILATLHEAIKHFGHFPTQLEMRHDLKYKALGSAMNHSGKRRSYYEEQMGLEPKFKDKGYWTSKENLKQEILTLVNKMNNIFPTLEMIRQELGHAAIKAIFKHYPSLYVACQDIGGEFKGYFIASDGHYVNSSYEYLLDEFLSKRGIPHSTNDYINKELSNFKYDFKIGDVYIEIWGYTKRSSSERSKTYADKRLKKEEFYKQQQLNLLSLNESLFEQPIEDIEQELERIFKEMGISDIPTTEDNTIKNLVNPNCYWTHDKIVEEIESVKADLGRYPETKDLKEIGRSDLYYAIKEHGGSVKFKKLLGGNLRVQWTDELIEQKLREVIADHGSLPSQIILQKGYPALNKAVSTHGGMIHWRQRLGLASLRGKTWTIEDMKSELLDLEKQVGSKPTYQKVDELNPRLLSALNKNKFSFRKYREEGKEIEKCFN